MRFFVFSICKCCGLLDDDPKDTGEAITNEELNCVTIKSITEVNFEFPFRIKEIRQRSVDYIVNSPRFGGAELPDGTGGTCSSPKRPPKPVEIKD